jgi:acyl-CoA thioester hydrolase
MTDTPRFRLTVRVYWEDTDAGGIVFYANHLKFFERSRTEWLRSLGFGQEQLRSGLGVLFVVAETTMRYLRPARLDDRLDVTVAVRSAGRASLVLAQQAWRDAELLCEGTIRLGCVDTASLQPRRIPGAILEAIA